jgi:hypothetical protein
MDIVQATFLGSLFLCLAYAARFGGRTGRAGAVIFAAATFFTALGAAARPDWAGTSYAVFATDAACLIALILLACNSGRYWPIWATGFQIVAVATHFASLWIPDIVPIAYQALLSFWSIPILGVMVAGTWLDMVRPDVGRSPGPSTEKGKGP